MIKAFFTVSFFTFLSRIAGFIRDILIANIVGTGVIAEVFLVAFKLPNFFRRLFAEGAFNAAFIPMFSHKLAEDGRKEAVNFAGRVMSVLTITLLVFVILMEIFMPYVMYGLAPGFAGDTEKFNLAIALTRITFPYLLFISLVSLFAGVLNGVGRFAAVSATPILLNLCLISALFAYQYFADSPTLAGYYLSYGVAIAGVIQFIWLWINCFRAGVRPLFFIPKITDEIRKFLRKMLPGIIGAGVMQINLWIDIVIGTFIPSAIAYLYFADRVNQLPLSIIGIAMGTAMLPRLSKYIKKGEVEKAISSQNRALEIVLFFTLPATAAIMIIALPIITVLFERGQFDASSSIATAYGLMGYAIGLPAFVMVKIFAPMFFASGDTKTPVKIAIICLFFNVILNISLVLLLQDIGFMPHIGLAIATSLSSWLNLFLLIKILRTNDDFKMEKITKNRIYKIIIATILMAIILYICAQYVALNITGLLTLIFTGMIVFLTASWCLKIFNISELKKNMSR